MKQLPECKLILDKLVNEAPERLYYHNNQHTLDVYESVSRIAFLKYFERGVVLFPNFL